MKDDINYSAYRYEVVDISFKLHIVVIDYIRGLFDRAPTFKKFCLDNGIDLPLQSEKRYHLPDYYTVESNELNNLSNIRDKKIIGKFDKYATLQREILKKLDELKQKLTEEKHFLKDNQKRLEKQKTQLANSKDHLDKIGLQSKISNQKTKIRNIEENVSVLEKQIENLKQLSKDNVENWQKQVEIIENTTDIQSEKYVSNCTRKITNRLNFKDFKYSRPVYSDNIIKIVKGKIND